MFRAGAGPFPRSPPSHLPFSQEAAAKVGKLVAELALAKNVTSVVFDRGGNVYHGRIKVGAGKALVLLQF